MSDGLIPYPAYKASGVPWLGQMPAHWAVKRAKNVFTRVDIRSELGSEELLTVSASDGVVPRREKTVTMFMAESYVGHKLCWPGDLVINSLWAWAKGLGFARHHGIVSSAYGVYRLLPQYREYWRYLDYALRSDVYQWEFQVRSKGIWVSRLQLTDESFFDMPVILPAYEDAQRIVSYLDHADRQIRRFIRAKRRTIELLNEQKQAIIHQAVTRGLDPNVPLKPSGVEWLGDVPAHWDVAKLQRLTTGIGDGLHGTPEYVDNSPYRFINGNNLVNGSIKLFPNTRCVSENEFRKYYIPLDSSTVLLSINGTVGSVALYQGEEVILGKSAAYINCDNDLYRSYLSYFLQSPGVRQYFKLQVSGTTIFNLSLASIRSLRIALPPLAEQLEISAFLQDRMAGLTKAIERVRDEIDLIREYHTRLIADVVTGKIDVRAAAQHLPNQIDDAELWDEDASEDEENMEEVEEDSPNDND